MNFHLITNMCEAAQAAKDVDSIEALEAIMTSYFRDIGIKMYSYRHLPPVGAMDFKRNRIISSHGFPASWEGFYEAEGYCSDDPMFKQLMRENRPLTWKNLIRACKKNHKTEKYLEQVKQLDVSYGIMIPVFGAQSRSGIFTIGFQQHVSEMSGNETMMLQCFCQITHHRYNAIFKASANQAVELTHREHEIIKLVTFGKTNCDIADILGISNHTINSYLRSVYLKLEVHDRVSASLRARSLGLV